VEWGYLTDAYGRTYFEDEAKIVIDRESVTSERMLRETMRHEACHVATRATVIAAGQDAHGEAWAACMRKFE
jgi:predicted SprT family Zn-dependent metalloprotease